MKTLITKKWKGYTLLDLIFILVGIGSIITTAIIFKSDWFYYIFTINWILCVFTQAKGKIITQFLGIIGCCFYFYICLSQKYYGEGFVYLFAMLPLYVYGVIHWFKHRQNDNIVLVRQKLSKKEIIISSVIYVVFSVGFFFLMYAVGTNKPTLNSISVITIIPAIYLLARRIKWNQVLFLINDLVVPILWIILIIQGNLSFIPMCICHLFQIIFDIYGLFEWTRIEKQQKNN